ncbi:MAG: DUF962 domain-containing protein [Pseudomonadota bacterium]
MNRSADYAEFWPRYLREHAEPGTRTLHFIGTGLTFVALAAALIFGRWALLALVPLLGYGFAWAGHALVERNRPATFTHPLWSLISDYRMFFLWTTGRLDAELARAGAAPNTSQAGA